MPSLEPIFHAAELDILVPATGSFPPAPQDSRERSAWWDALRALPSRDTVFLDEKVAYAVSLRVPSDVLPSASPSPSSPHAAGPGIAPPELAALAKHLQMTATVSFLPPLAPAPVGFAERRSSLAPPPPVAKDRTPTKTASPTKHRPSPISPPRIATLAAVAAGTPTPNGPPTASLNLPLPQTPGATVPPTPASATSAAHQPGRPPIPEAGEGGPPLTPRPVPATSPGAEEYADLEGVTVWEGEVAVDGETRPTLVRTADGWIAVWCGEMSVVYVRTQIANPVLGITASATLRAKPRKPAGAASDTASIRSVGTVASTQTEDVDVEEEEEDIDLAHMEDIDLLGGLAATPVPFSRLSPAIRGDITPPTPRSSTPRSHSIPTAPVQLSLSASTTMRKSFRRVLGLSPGLRVRMRTIFLPQFLPPGAAAEESEDNAERKIVVCVEVENGADSGDYAFEVEQVTVEVGGKGPKATAELVCQPGMEPRTPGARPSPPETPGFDTVFPLELSALEQYNLLYAVTIASSPGSVEVPRHKGEENRVVSIVLIGRPYRLQQGSKAFPTAPFQSRWNCNLDLTPFYSTLPPAPPPPPAPRQKQRPAAKVVAPAPNAIAGDRRYALANLIADDRQVVTNPARPNVHLPLQALSGRAVSGRYAGDGHGLLVSVRVLPGGEGSIAPAPLATDTQGTIYPLDTFSIEVFVHNRTDTVRRFRLAVPAREADTRIRDLWSRRRRRAADEAAYGVDDAVLGALLAQYEAAAPALVPLETDVRCGPLLPGASLAARIKFLALRDGVHRIERLRLTGMEGEFDFSISPVLEVVVAQKAE
ncbi:hypothetical protein CC85DRAFT_300431 [Cutaneotrichosporon oleaginosum]|uniref:Trafficking protein particle complex II-specific subunit 65 IgD3 domain-containing protein n=1 Tax=Cutaneotrichosporon oleaginosum TaxID=879819 RepID=A0A0J0XU31_9TREE|nr:uncharacterized protein CC85DRAFT_300431 [Cutaneotrichosporon oleaginosum]KLT44593.1 hypothetical protein CC85DRAFT_300431 [Cutaneotrichosporon oleaginosum]TXT13892.1 hypothetical protein COLE_00085 [Cutaneotrichosporon oleaginosum]